VAHTLKGAVANFGPSPALDAATRLEMQTRDGNLAGAAAALLDQLDSTLARLTDNPGRGPCRSRLTLSRMCEGGLSEYQRRAAQSASERGYSRYCDSFKTIDAGTLPLPRARFGWFAVQP